MILAIEKCKTSVMFRLFLQFQESKIQHDVHHQEALS